MWSHIPPADLSLGPAASGGALPLPRNPDPSQCPLSPLPAGKAARELPPSWPRPSRTPVSLSRRRSPEAPSFLAPPIPSSLPFPLLWRRPPEVLSFLAPPRLGFFPFLLPEAVSPELGSFGSVVAVCPMTQSLSLVMEGLTFYKGWLGRPYREVDFIFYCDRIHITVFTMLTIYKCTVQWY